MTLIQKTPITEAELYAAVYSDVQKGVPFDTAMERALAIRTKVREVVTRHNEAIIAAYDETLRIQEEEEARKAEEFEEDLKSNIEAVSDIQLQDLSENTSQEATEE